MKSKFIAASFLSVDQQFGICAVGSTRLSVGRYSAFLIMFARTKIVADTGSPHVAHPQFKNVYLCQIAQTQLSIQIPKVLEHFAVFIGVNANQLIQDLLGKLLPVFDRTRTYSRS